MTDTTSPQSTGVKIEELIFVGITILVLIGFMVPTVYVLKKVKFQMENMAIVFIFLLNLIHIVRFVGATMLVVDRTKSQK